MQITLGCKGLRENMCDQITLGFLVLHLIGRGGGVILFLANHKE